MSTDLCPARAEPGPHHFVEYVASARPSSSMWGSTKTPVAVFCRWCGAWSPLTYAANVTPPALDDIHANLPDDQPAKPLKMEQVPNA